MHAGPIPRYDLLLLLCLAAQALFLRIGYETMREFKVIMAFHGIGLVLEILQNAFSGMVVSGAVVLAYRRRAAV